MTLSANNGGTRTPTACAAGEGNAVGSRAGLTAWEQSIVVGLLLGDGHLERSRRGLARLHVRQHPTRRDYVDWLYQQLQRFVRTPPKIVMSQDRRTQVATPRYGFKTLAYPVFGEWHRRFYDGRQKRIPEGVGNWLEPTSLAVWFADDGSFKTDSRGLLLNTNAFSMAEQQRLQGALQQRFGLTTTLHRLREWHRIYIPARSSDRFIELIMPQLPTCVLYKLALTPERLIPYGRDRRIRLPRFRVSADNTPTPASSGVKT